MLVFLPLLKFHIKHYYDRYYGIFLQFLEHVTSKAVWKLNVYNFQCIWHQRPLKKLSVLVQIRASHTLLTLFTLIAITLLLRELFGNHYYSGVARAVWLLLWCGGSCLAITLEWRKLFGYYSVVAGAVLPLLGCGGNCLASTLVWRELFGYYSGMEKAACQEKLFCQRNIDLEHELFD